MVFFQSEKKLLAPCVYKTFNTENVVNIYKQWKFNFILKVKVVSVRSLVEWPLQQNNWWSMKMIVCFKDGKEGSKGKKIFRNYAVIWWFRISIFHGKVLLCPLYCILPKIPITNPLETCNCKIFISEKTSRSPLVQPLLPAVLGFHWASLE